MLEKLLLASSLLAFVGAQCPSGATYYSPTDRCFYYNKHLANWYDSSTACRNMGGQLISIHTHAENTFIYNTWQNMNPKPQFSPWIGLKYDYTKMNWTWTDNTTVDYLNWDPTWYTPNFTNATSCICQDYLESQWSESPCMTDNLPSFCELPKVGATTPTPSTACPGGQRFNGNCYLFNSTATSWDQARSNCLIQGGDLVSMHSSAENQFINNKAKSLGISVYWIGLNRELDATLNYTWSDGSSYNYQSWYPTVPGSCITGAQNCVSEDAGTAQWFNCWNCSHALPYVCEIRSSSVQVLAAVEKKNLVKQQEIRQSRALRISGNLNNLLNLKPGTLSANRARV